MSGKCRLCYSNNIKITITTKDSIIQTLADLVPEIKLSDDPFLTISVCQLCHSKAKICTDFIVKIKNTQMMFIKNNHYPRVELEDVFKKIQKTPGVSIKKITASKAVNSTETSTTHPQNEIFFENNEEIKIKEEEQDVEILVEVPIENMVHDFNDDHDYDDMDNESIKESINEDDDLSENITDVDSDKNYAPSKKKLIKNSDAPAKRKGPAPVERVIDGPIDFSCTKCKSYYNTFYELVDHMKTKTCFTAEEFTCDICPKTFQNGRALSRHKMTHKPKTKLMCEECAKTFANKFDLEMHMLSAHNHVPSINSKLVFKCTYCTEEFDNHVDLFTHVKEHAREKKEGPKLCETCGKNLCNLKSYQAHIKTHLDAVKNFVCPVCDKRFSKGFLLAQHSHIHTGIKMFKCDSCDKSFAKRDSLRLHNKKYHQDEITDHYDYKCEDCKIGFKLFEQFKNHVTKCNSRNS